MVGDGHGSRVSSVEPLVVSDVVRFRQLTHRQVQRLHFARGASQKSMDNQCYRVLNRLVARGAIGRIKAGPGAAGNVFQGPKATTRQLNPHTHDIAELYVHLTEAARADRCLLLEYEPEPYCHRRIAGKLLKPDARLRVEVAGLERNRYLEADRGSEWPVQIREKLRQYRSAIDAWPGDEVFPRVVFVVSHEIPERIEARMRLIARELEKAPAEYWPYFSVASLHEAVGHLLAPA